MRELARVCYNKSDTIKVFLLKLYNSKLDLPKNSLIVIDKSGKVGYDDYSERRAAAIFYWTRRDVKRSLPINLVHKRGMILEGKKASGAKTSP